MACHRPSLTTLGTQATAGAHYDVFRILNRPFTDFFAAGPILYLPVILRLPKGFPPWKYIFFVQKMAGNKKTAAVAWAVFLSQSGA
jgi:hypothetical protein